MDLPDNPVKMENWNSYETHRISIRKISRSRSSLFSLRIISFLINFLEKNLSLVRITSTRLLKQIKTVFYFGCLNFELSTWHFLKSWRRRIDLYKSLSRHKRDKNKTEPNPGRFEFHLIQILWFFFLVFQIVLTLLWVLMYFLYFHWYF